MPGAPPVMLLSVADRTLVPFSYKEIADPTAVSSSCVPAGSGLTLKAPLICAQPPPDRLNSISSGLPKFQ